MLSSLSRVCELRHLDVSHHLDVTQLRNSSQRCEARRVPIPFGEDRVGDAVDAAEKVAEATGAIKEHAQHQARPTLAEQGHCPLVLGTQPLGTDLVGPGLHCNAARSLPGLAGQRRSARLLMKGEGPTSANLAC